MAVNPREEFDKLAALEEQALKIGDFQIANFYGRCASIVLAGKHVEAVDLWDFGLSDVEAELVMMNRRHTTRA